MNWHLVLSFYFLNSVTGGWVPDEYFSSGIQRRPLSMPNEYAPEHHNAYETPDLFGHNNVDNALKSHDCFASISTKKMIIDILQIVKQNPDVIDDIIEEINAEIEQDAELIHTDFKPDNRRSILFQLQLQNQYYANDLDDPPQCAKAIAQLAEIAHKAYMDFKNSPACLKFILPDNETTVHPGFYAQNTHPDIKMAIALILKQMGLYNDPLINSVVKPHNNHIPIPEINLQTWNFPKPYNPDIISKPNEINHQLKPFRDFFSAKGLDVMETKPLSVFKPKPQLHPNNDYILQKLPNHEKLLLSENNIPISIPRPLTGFKPKYLPFQLLPPVMPNLKPNPAFAQDLNIYAPGPLGTNPLDYSTPDKFQAKLTGPHIFNKQPNPDVFSIYNVFENHPKITERPQESIVVTPKIVYLNDYNNAKPVVNSPVSVINQQPKNDGAYSYYKEIQSFLPGVQQPGYQTNMDIKPLSPMKHFIKYVLPFLKQEQSSSEIDKILIMLEHNRGAFEPKLYVILFALLDSYKKGLIDSNIIYEIYSSLLKPDTNNIWNEEKRDLIWQLLKPDETGQINVTNINIILSLIRAVDQDSYSLNRPIQLPPLSNPKEEGHSIDTPGQIVHIVNQIKKTILTPDQGKILLALIESSKKGPDHYKYVEVVKTLANWQEIPYLNWEYVNNFFSLLNPNNHGMIDKRAVEVIHKIILLKKLALLTTEDINMILAFLKSDADANSKSKRLDIVLFISNNILGTPSLKNAFIQLLDSNVVKSKYLNILLSLNRENILNSQLLEAIITLLKQERTGYIDNYIIHKVLIMLQPYRSKHPEIIGDIFKQLRTSSSSNYPSESKELDTNTDKMKLLQNDSSNKAIQRQLTGFKVFDIAPQTNGYNWIEYNPNAQKSNLNYDLLVKLLQMSPTEQNFYAQSLEKYGFIELTYMINNQLPIYKPMHYVKYKIPMDNFLTRIRSLNDQNAQRSPDPTQLLQKLLLDASMSEVSPTLKGINREDILRLTFNNGDLVQAKLLEEKNSNLNEQIRMVQNLNAEISPEEILLQSNRNSAQYFNTLNGNIGGMTSMNNNYLGSVGYEGTYPQYGQKRPVISNRWVV